MGGQFVVLVFAICTGVQAREFQFLNNLPGEVWIGCQGNPGHEHLNGGGWKLAAGQWVRYTKIK